MFSSVSSCFHPTTTHILVNTDTMHTLCTENAGLRAENAALRELLTSLARNAQTLSTENADLRTELNDLRKRFAGLVRSAQYLNEQVQTLYAEKREAESQNDCLREAVDRYEVDVFHDAVESFIAHQAKLDAALALVRTEVSASDWAFDAEFLEWLFDEHADDYEEDDAESDYDEDPVSFLDTREDWLDI